MKDTQTREAAAKERAAARRARRQRRRENQWAQGKLLLFVLLYNLLFQLVVQPLGRMVWGVAVNLSPAKYITSANLGLILRSPLIWAAILLIGVGYASWALLEIAGIVICVDCAQRQQRIGLWPLLRRSVMNIAHVLRPKNLPLLLFAAVIMPLTNLFVASDLVRQLTVPEYIMEVIQANPLYYTPYLGLMVVLLLWTLAWAMVFHCFVLEHKDLPQAAGSSIRMMKGNVWRVVWRVLRNQVTFFVHWCLVLGAGLLVMAYVLVQCSDGSTLFARAAALGWNQFTYPAARFLLRCLATFVQYVTLTSLYHEIKAERGEPLAPLPPESRPQQKPGLLARAAAPVLLSLVAVGGLLLTGVFYLAGMDESGLLADMLQIKTEITSHRGFSAKAPENTLPSVQAAIDCGVSDYAEIDVQQTSDGVVVLTHDTNLKRCTGVDVNVHEISYEELRKLDASKGYTGADADRFAGTPIPTLDEVIKLCKAHGLKLNIEIKGATPTLEEETVRIIRENGFEQQCVITSLRYDALEKVKQIAPELKTGYIMAMGVGNYYDLAAADAFSVESTFVTAGMVEQLHLRGKEVYAWTIDEKANAKRMIAMGVDNLITGDPEMVYNTISSTESLGVFSLLSNDTWEAIFQAVEEQDSAAPAKDDSASLLDAA